MNKTRELQDVRCMRVEHEMPEVSEKRGAR